METPPRTQMASYLERWEQQKAQSRRLRQQRRRSSDVGDELSFISALEREAAQDERNEAEEEVLDERYQVQGDDSFDLPAMDAFPASEVAEQGQEQQKMPRDDEFIDAATFLKKNELGGEDSFSEDVGNQDWDQMNSSGRPSDFFERKSRNLDHVELSSPRNVDVPLFEADDDEDEEEEPGLRTPKQQPTSTGLAHGVSLRDRFNRSSGLSGSDTAISSDYDVHFDSTKLMYTPNSLKYLQEKNRFRGVGGEIDRDYSVADYTGEARTVTKKVPSLSDQETAEDPSSEYVANLAQGPGVIKETLHEIDALIDNSIRLASTTPTKDAHGVELSDDMREFVREYERPLESMLPLSRTTDSWGEDASASLIDDDVSRRSRESDRLSFGIEPCRQTTNSVRRSRSQETPELDTIREVPCPSNTESASRSPHSADSRQFFSKPSQYEPHTRIESNADHGAPQRREEHIKESLSKASSGTHFSGVTSKCSDELKSRATSATFDQSLADVAATQNPFRDQLYRSKGADADCVDEEHEHSTGNSFVDDQDYDQYGDGGAHQNGELIREDDSLSSKADATNRHHLRFRYGEHAQQLQSALRNKCVDGQRQVIGDRESRSSAVSKQSVPTDRLVSVLDHDKLRVTMNTAMMPRRCRRFLCSVGDIMTEQIVFTNGTNSVGRICVSLLPLSTGCQQFSVSPAVLELGPQGSSAFHVTFNARYAGAVSGIFQFRGVGSESLFHPYEVVIEASVRRHLELGAPKSLKAPQEDPDTCERVQELQASSSVDQVEISPMFIRFDRVRSKSGEHMIRKAKLRLSNNSAETLPFKIRALENLRIRPATGMILAASEVIVSVLPISQPFVQRRAGGDTSTNPSPRTENWVGSLTVRVGKSYLREVSVVVDRRAIQMLPPFDEIARSRHQLSSQTDSFYYTKRGKRRGLYFHARAVEFGCCNVGESHEVPVYVCNGSKTPMTVFLQDLQEPFSCAYSTTTIEPRKFIEIMVMFTPKVVGKVATSLFAYSVSDKAVVTLVARGI